MAKITEPTCNCWFKDRRHQRRRAQDKSSRYKGENPEEVYNIGFMRINGKYIETWNNGLYCYVCGQKAKIRYEDI